MTDQHSQPQHPAVLVERVARGKESEHPPALIVSRHKRRLRSKRMLGEGAYGCVVEYTVAGHGVAIKIERIKKPDAPGKLLRSAADRRSLATPDSEAAKILDTVFWGHTGGLLGVRYLGLHADGSTGAVHLYSMPVMDGSLGDKGALEMLIERFRHPDDPSRTRPPVLRIVELVRRQMMLLMRIDRRLCYTDLKIANILYRTRGSDRPEIWLGDFGSAMMDGDQEYTFTYPNPPSGKPFQALAAGRDRLAAMSYQIGVLLAECVGIDIRPYSHDHCAIPLDSSPLQRDLARAYGPGLATLVATDPADRRDITIPLIQ